MALLPSNQRDQIMLVICAAALGLVYVYYQYVHTKKEVVLETLQARVEKLEEGNEVIRQEVARGTAATLKREADVYGRMLSVMRELVPIANEVPTLLDQISTAARQTGLEVGEVTPLGVIGGEVFDTHRYKMSVLGPYHRIARFFDNVGSLTRIVAPMNVSLAPTAKGAAMRRPNEELLEAGFEVQTFVAKTAPPRQRTAGPGN